MNPVAQPVRLSLVLVGYFMFTFVSMRGRPMCHSLVYVTDPSLPGGVSDVTRGRWHAQSGRYVYMTDEFGIADAGVLVHRESV